MHFYLHIPFCRQKCPYCKFALTPIFDEAKKRRYIAHLKSEIREYFHSVIARYEAIQDPENTKHGSLHSSRWQTPGTIYFGGGTPSVLSLDEVREILECFREAPFAKELSEVRRKTEDFFLKQNPPDSPLQGGFTEISFECNPEDITSEYIEWLLALGVNRLSVGIQSLSDATLKAIHRSDRDSISHALDAIWSVIARNESVPVTNDVAIQVPGILDCFVPRNDKNTTLSINIDFILGLPYSKPGETLANIRELHAEYPYITHTSVYMLEDELYPPDWKASSISEGEMQEEYIEIIEYFSSLGWHHYELSNWSKPGYECEHNAWYWDHSEYRWYGLSASSFVWGERWTNSSSFVGYYRWVKEGEEILTDEDIQREKIMFGLRTGGVDVSLLDREKYIPLRDQDLLKICGTTISPTKTWIFLLDHIISRLW